ALEIHSKTESFHCDVVPLDSRSNMRTLVVFMLTPFLFFAPALSAESARPRIAIGGISHESNSFNPSKTKLADFKRRNTEPFDQVLLEWAKSNDEVSGYIEGARRFGLDLYPTLVAAADPKGPVTDEAFNTLVEELIGRLRSTPRLDGLL